MITLIITGLLKGHSQKQSERFIFQKSLRKCLIPARQRKSVNTIKVVSADSEKTVETDMKVKNVKTKQKQRLLQKTPKMCITENKNGKLEEMEIEVKYLREEIDSLEEILVES